MQQPVGEVGPALPAADAAFLSHELAQRGIEARLREAGKDEMVVEVAAGDLERAVGSVVVLHVGRGLGPGLRAPFALAAGPAAYLIALLPQR